MRNESKKVGVGGTVGPLASGHRWSVARKRDVVLRMLKGEPLDALSRELCIELHRLEEWRDRAIMAMEACAAPSFPDHNGANAARRS